MLGAIVTVIWLPVSSWLPPIVERLAFGLLGSNAVWYLGSHTAGIEGEKQKRIRQRIQ